MRKQWDRIFKKSGKVFYEVHKDLPRIVRIFKKRHFRRILDLGCGSGRHLIYLAKNGFDVYGLDIAEHGIEISKSWLREWNLQAKLKVWDFYKKLPYKNDFFDAVISIKSFHHGKIENIRKTIKEVERVLKPRGLIFITVSKRKSRKDIKQIHKNKLWKIKFIAPRTYIPLNEEEKGLIHYLFNKKILRKEFRNFKIFYVKVDSEGHYAIFGELKSK